MAVSGKIYRQWISNTISTSPQTQCTDLLSDTIKVALYTSANTITQATDTNYATTNECTGTGYSAGGVTLGTKTYAVSSLTTAFDAADSAYTTVTISTAAQAHVYDSTTTIKSLICYQDFGGIQQVVANDLVIVWNASGLFTFAVT